VPLAGYVAATVVSPDEREAAVRFQAAGPVAFYLNGQPVEVAPAEGEELDVHPFFRSLRQTNALRLRAGENTLVVDSRPDQSEQSAWFFGGAFVTPDGDLMTDLAFK